MFIHNIEKWLNILLKYSNCKYCKVFKECLHFLMLCKNIKSYDVNRTLKKTKID